MVSFGTSAPEPIVSLLSAINGNSDASIGNVIGSNNFNLLCILGIAGLIYPLVVQRNTVRFEVPISLLGLGMLVGGGKLVVDNALKLAEHYGFSQKLIGLTILAAGTSLPELATSSVAANRKKTPT